MHRISWYLASCVFTLCAATVVFAQAPAASDDAALKATANPDLVGAVAKEIGATPKQAEGATGALFGLAKSRLPADEFAKVSSAVPGMDGLLKAAPSSGGDPMSKGAGTAGKSAGGLASVAGSFSKLGLTPDIAAKVVPVLTDYVSKSGGADVAKLLGDALK